MDLSLSPEQELLKDTFRSFFTRESPTQLVRDSEPTGFSKSLWEQLVQLGAPGMGTSRDRGGSGASLLDLSLVVEQAGAALAPIPLVEHVVALRLLERLPESPDDIISSSAAGRSIATLNLHASDGVSKVTPGAAVADVAVVRTSEQILLVIPEERPILTRNLGCLPIGDVPLDQPVRSLGRSSRALEQHARAVDEWRILSSAQLVGLADTALSIGIEYVRSRQQFGRAIGSFQAVAHGLAEVSGPISGARLLAQKAAWAADVGHDRTAELARMAFAMSSEVAEQVTYRCLHYHGGYGVMEEYDIGLYFRRARGWPQVLHSADTELEGLGALLHRVETEQT